MLPTGQRLRPARSRVLALSSEYHRGPAAAGLLPERLGADEGGQSGGVTVQVVLPEQIDVAPPIQVPVVPYQ